MAIQPDGSVYGGQSVVGPGFVNLNEDVIGSAAKSFEDLAEHIRSEVIPATRKKNVPLIG